MRIFKTKEFARLARKEGIDDLSLYQAVQRAQKGLIDATIGKFLIKQRVARRNEGRSGGFRTIIFYQQANRSVFLHLFAKNEKDSLTNTEEVTYREFAKSLATIRPDQVKVLVETQKWIEIDSDDGKEKIS
jgi:hypothetical protein